jgi:hypothetical protein
MNYKADWSFSGLSNKRTKMLSRCPAYSEIISRIVKQVRLEEIDFKIDRGYLHPMTGVLRPLFYITIEAELADLFFNGVCGYRAQYYRSAENGVFANRYAIQQIEPKLLEAARIAGWHAPDRDHPGSALHMEEAQIRASFRLASAKIWGDETEGEMSSVMRSVDPTPQIIAMRWVKATRIENEARKSKAIMGVKAPCLSILKYHGAFIKDGEERIPCGKERRSEDIHFYGWS